MQQVEIPRLVIAGTHSGAGKTTIVTGLLAALRNRGLNVQSYKVGPDYIDPGYHQLASGKPSHNLDTWLLPPEKLLPFFSKSASGNDMAVIEGVMGLYDGGRSGISSTAAIAKELKAPVVLVIDAKSMGESAAAVALGYTSYDPAVNIIGVIFNRVGSPTHKAMIADAMERLGIPVLGFLPRDVALTTPERHLGLKPVTEHDAQATITTMQQWIENHLNIDALLEEARKACPLEKITALYSPDQPLRRVRVAVAQDEAFSFYYPESLETLNTFGADLIPFSPLTDTGLPPDVDGVILGGGFPEMFLPELSANHSMHQALQAAHAMHMPIYAECGGLMYLTQGITDFNGQMFPLVGLLPATCAMQHKLQTVGYVTATAVQDTLLCRNNESLRGHEFHFSQMTPEPAHAADFAWAFQFTKTRTGQTYYGGYAKHNLLASYLHFHFAGHPAAAKRFINHCLAYRQARQGGRQDE